MPMGVMCRLAGALIWLLFNLVLFSFFNWLIGISAHWHISPLAHYVLSFCADNLVIELQADT